MVISANITGGIGGLSVGGFNVGGTLNAMMRTDPEIPYKFAFELDGIANVHFKEVGGLKFTTEVQKVREGGNNMFEHSLIKSAKFEPLKIKRGFYGAHTHFYNWMRTLHDPSQEFERVTGVLQVLMDNKVTSAEFEFFNVYPVSFQGPAFDATSKGAIAFEEIEIGFDYFELKKISAAIKAAKSAAASAAATAAIHLL